MWNKAKDIKPPLYDVMSYEISAPVLAYNVFNRKNYIASFWIFPEVEAWRDNETGEVISVTHWQEINNPKD